MLKENLMNIFGSGKVLLYVCMDNYYIYSLKILKITSMSTVTPSSIKWFYGTNDFTYPTIKYY